MIDANRSVLQKPTEVTSDKDDTEKKRDEVEVQQETKKKSRVRYIERQSDGFGEYTDKEVDDFGDAEDNEHDKKAAVGAQDDDYAIAWRRSRSKGPGEAGTRELLIQSQDLRKALKNVLQDYPLSFDTEEVVINAPYEVIYHNTKSLEEYAEKTDEATRADIKTLLKEVEQVQATKRRDAETLTKSGYITYDLLWTLFFPGRKVCQKHLGEVQVSIIAPAFSTPTEDKHPLVLWSLDYDGTNFTYLQTQVTIKSFKGSKAIVDLSVYPLDNWKGEDGKGSSCSRHQGSTPAQYTSTR
jgi:hypothetical protein